MDRLIVLATELGRYVKEQDVDRVRGTLGTVERTTSVAERLQILNALDEHGYAALHWTAEQGQSTIADLLLRCGAHASIKDSAGWSPLHWAADHGHNEVGAVLLQRMTRAGVNDLTNDGESALFLAATNSNHGFIELLLKSGGNASCCMSGTPVLFVAIENGSTEVLRLLLEHNADVSAVGRRGNTCLHMVAATGNVECCRLLLKHGGSMLVSRANDDGENALHIAARCGEVAVLNELMRTNVADVDALCHSGLAPLHHASLGGHHAACIALVEGGAAVNKTSLSGATALHMARQGNHVPVSQALLALGATLDPPDVGPNAGGASFTQARDLISAASARKSIKSTVAKKRPLEEDSTSPMSKRRCLESRCKPAHKADPELLTTLQTVHCGLDSQLGALDAYRNRARDLRNKQHELRTGVKRAMQAMRKAFRKQSAELNSLRRELAEG